MARVSRAAAGGDGINDDPVLLGVTAVLLAVAVLLWCGLACVQRGKAGLLL